MNTFERNAHLVSAKSTPETRAALDGFYDWRYKKEEREYRQRIGWPRYLARKLLSRISYYIWWEFRASRGWVFPSEGSWRWRLGRWLNRMSVRVTYRRAEYERVFGKK